MTHRILVIPGDGIGAEVMPHVLRVLDTLDLDLSFESGELGGVAIDRFGTPLPTPTLEAARASDAVLLGAVGGPKWDGLPMEHRPEKGLLGLRAGLDAFANLRPAMLFAPLADASSLRPELVAGLDMLIVRELTGGIYFGEPRGVEDDNGRRRGFNTDVYTEDEIERIARVAFDLAGKRAARLTSVDKANVLEVTQLWRTVVTEVHADFPNIELDHLYVDNAAMQLVRAPKQFDVIVTGNLFGDILSDAAAMLTGSLGMLPSASLNAKGQGIYEPVHGSAPDIAGRNVANPLATILSAAMMLRYSLGEADAADRVEAAVNTVLEDGIRTADIMPAEGADGVRKVGTEAMADAVIGAL